MLQRKTLILLLTTLLTAAIAVPASAAVEEGTSSFEVYAGIYFPDGPVFDEAATYGVRLGHVFSARWGGEISAGYYNDDVNVGVIHTDLDIINIDLDAVFFANPDARAVFSIYGGIGWANTDVTITDKGLGTSASTDSDSFTGNLGIGVRITLGQAERAFIRLDGRARYFDDRNSDDVDFEATVGFGWIWGN